MCHNEATDIAPRTDITALFIFHKPDDPDKSVLILNVNPEVPAYVCAFDAQVSCKFERFYSGCTNQA